VFFCAAVCHSCCTALVLAEVFVFGCGSLQEHHLLCIVRADCQCMRAHQAGCRSCHTYPAGVTLISHKQAHMLVVFGFLRTSTSEVVMSTALHEAACWSVVNLPLHTAEQLLCKCQLSMLG
jgi:hypothetical protein